MENIRQLWQWVFESGGDLDAAQALYKQSLAIDEALGRKQGMAQLYANLGLLAQRRGNMPEACAKWKKALALFRQVGMEPQIAQVEGWMREAGCAE